MPFSDVLAAVRWWLVLLALGALAAPLTGYFLRRLPDRGYAFSKMVGLLVVSYLFWLLSSLGFVGNNLGGILLAAGGLLALSAWAARRKDEVGGMKDEGQANAAVHPSSFILHPFLPSLRQIVITEWVFALIFALWVWVRSQNPAIVATEKPMELAFLNAVGRSPTFPPLDPWLSGYAISYYYFGYVMTSVIGRLAGVAEPIAFNLGIAWLTAGSAVGAFGLVYNLVAADRTGFRKPVRSRPALVLGLVAALALPIAGNMETLLEVLHANRIGSADFWQWLDVRDLNRPPDGRARYATSEWWWWRSSRVIHEYHLSGRSEEGLEPIAEFPGFSFVLGDMHPHVLALPFAFVSLAVALAWYLDWGGRWPVAGEIQNPKSKIQNGKGGRWQSADVAQAAGLPAVGKIQNPKSKIQNVGIPTWLFTALVLGGLSFLNTWDVLIHLFVVVGAFVLAQWRTRGRWNNELIGQAAVVGLLLVIPAVLLYLPFYLGFRSQAGPPFLLPMLMRPTRLAHFLIIFAMPLWSIVLMVVAVVARQRQRPWRVGLGAAVAPVGVLLLLMLFLGWVVASSPDGAGRVMGLANELGIQLAAPSSEGVLARLGWGASAAAALLPPILAARLQTPALTLFLATLLGLSVMALHYTTAETPRAQRELKDHLSVLRVSAVSTNAAGTTLPFVLLMVLTGALLTLGPEFVYLRDNFGVRLNTIFKFYYQAWVLFGVAAVCGLDYLLRETRVTGVVATAVYAAALAAALLFPFYAVQSRAAEFRGPVTAATRQSPTLDGMANLKRFQPDDYEAISWLRQNVSGAPVIVEAVGGQYSSFGRVSAHTGLPTLLGWAGHEGQWRGTSTNEYNVRDGMVKTIYNEEDWEQVAALLDQFDVQYIYVGPLEMTTYNRRGLDKFAERLPAVYQNGSVTIYQWAGEGE
ncbi:MAG: DUF2298 domain-containing protein [Chloroflexota bacterium]